MNQDSHSELCFFNFLKEYSKIKMNENIVHYTKYKNVRYQLLLLILSTFDEHVDNEKIKKIIGNMDIITTAF